MRYREIILSQVHCHVLLRVRSTSNNARGNEQENDLTPAGLNVAEHGNVGGSFNLCHRRDTILSYSTGYFDFLVMVSFATSLFCIRWYAKLQ